MVLKKAESQMRVMLEDTIVALCRNALPYQTNVCVQGLLAVTMDDQEIFLININEKILREGLNQKNEKRKNESEKLSDNSDNDSVQSDGSSSPREQKRKKRRKRRGGEQENVDSEESRDGEVRLNESGHASRCIATDTVRTVPSSERLEHRHKEDFFIKQEPQDDSMFGQNFGGRLGLPLDGAHVIGTSDQSEAMLHLQHLALQISGESPSATSMLPVSIH